MNKSIRPPPYYLLCLLCSGFMLFQDRQCILEAFDELLRVFGTTSTKQRHTGESGGEGEGEGEGGFRNGRCLTNSGHLRSFPYTQTTPFNMDDDDDWLISSLERLSGKFLLISSFQFLHTTSDMTNFSCMTSAHQYI